MFGMKENLMIQYILPDYELPEEYSEVLESIDHSKIASSESVYASVADVVVLNGWNKDYAFDIEGVYVLRVDKRTLFEKTDEIAKVLKDCVRLNIVITDVEKFSDADFETYKTILGSFSKELETLYIAGKSPQLNLLTDRMMLDGMNNCNAGSESITLAPDGRFYVCPGFYYDGLGSVGSLAEGLCIRNPHLYELEYAPICRICDSYHCKRCVWMNRKTTLEVNTPSHEQCVMSHIERNASRAFVLSLKDDGMSDEIPEIDYLDPFDELIKNR